MSKKAKSTHSPKFIISTALFGALAIVLPIVFHMLSLGHVFMPMFIPIAVASFLLPLQMSILLGLIVPIFSSVLTGMPPLLMPPIGLIMMVELTTLVTLNWLFATRLRLPIFVAASVALILNRGIYLWLVFLMATVLHLPQVSFSIYSVVKTLPGLIILVTIVPTLSSILRKYV